jgi:porin
VSKYSSYLLGCLVATLFTQNGLAQDAPTTKSHNNKHTPTDIDESQPPFVLDLTYTADVWNAASGGVGKVTRYLDNLDIVAEADMEQLAGWSGALIRVYGLYNNGKSISELVGDAQVISNIETGVKAIRLYEAWLQQNIGGAASLKIGLYDLNSEFDVLDSSGLFMGSAHGIGTDISQSGLNGPSIFPSTSLAARLEIEPASGWKLRIAVLDGVPGDPDSPKRTAIKLGNGDGALLIGEVEAPISDGKLLLGHWRYTARFDDWAGGRRNGNDGWYLRGERQLTSERNDPKQGLSGFLRLGFAVASAFTSKDYRLTSFAERSETAFELTYRTAITDWLTLQPNVQYVINPGVDPNVRNALAFGLRAELTYRFSR